LINIRNFVHFTS